MKKTMTTTQKIKALIELGKTNVQIIETVPKATRQQIYNQRYQVEKTAKKMLGDYREKHRKIVEVWDKLGSFTTTPQESKPANEVQIGGTHYKDKGLQPWDAIAAWDCGFLDGNVIKYVVRYRSKGGVEDLKKARHYLDKLIELEELK